jgi:AcrR family transcriptional regulator
VAGSGGSATGGRESAGVTQLGDGRRRLGEVQRLRLLSAIARVACEEGAAGVTVSSAIARAGISRRTFYEIFGSSEEGVLAALESALVRARERVIPAYSSAEGGWSEQIRAGLAALLVLLDAEPDTGKLLLVESQFAGPVARERRRRVLARIAEALDRGRAEAKGAFVPPQLAAEMLVGGLAGVLGARLSHPRRGDSLLDLLGPLMSIVVLPYLGSAAARRELGRPAPEPSLQAARSSDGDPLSADWMKELGIRVTYRTMRALAALAEHPGASNRAIGAVAGIDDQGQVSKLLARLQRLGLARNQTERESGKGAPNAWSLTPSGERLERALRVGPPA